MIKKQINEILMGYYNEDGTYSCTWTTVVDQAATNAAIKECEDGWQAEIDECQSQIDQYKELKAEIGKKATEAQSLQSEFSNNTNLLQNANVVHPKTDLGPCDTCLTELLATYDSMSAQCDTEMDSWAAKKSAAESKKGSCPADTPKVYKDVCI